MNALPAQATMNNRYRKFYIAGGSVPVVSVEVLTDGPFNTVRLSYSHDGRQRYRQIVGTPADTFIAWERSVTDWCAQFHADDLPPELAKYLPEREWVAATVSLSLPKFIGQFAHAGEPTSAA